LRDRPTKEDYSDAMTRFADKVIANLSPEEVAGNGRLDRPPVDCRNLS